MPRQIVVVVFGYEAETPEQAEQDVRDIEARYEGASVVAAAPSLAELPHPSQIPGAEEVLTS